MLSRVVSIIIMTLIAIPLTIIGGLPFKIFVCLIGLAIIKEFLDVRKIEKPVKYTAYLFLTTLFIDINLISLIASVMLTFALFVIYYRDSKKYSVVDSFYVIAGLIIVLLALNYVAVLRNQNFLILIYLLLITTMTDTYAYTVGSLIGRHKLVAPISPNKTIEGFFGGLFGGVFIASIFYIVNFNNINILNIIFQTTILSLLGQFGDLFFSALKRDYQIKDYSNLIPGHGGMLDRLDSFIFVLIGYLLFI